MQVFVNYDDARWGKYNIDFKRIATAAGPRRAGAEVSITLTDDATIRRLNKQYRGMDRPTNVLSFELGDDMLLGDIYISLDTVAREAAAAGISVAEHTAHMVVHGMLHLQGYDHLNDSDAEKMESREVRILKRLGIKNPYDDELAVDRRGRGLRSFWRGVLLGALGAAAALGFAPTYMWWATVAAIGAAYWILSREGMRGGFWRGYLRAMPFGAAYALAMFWWTLSSIYVVPELAAQFAIWTVPGAAGLAAAGALIFSIPFAAAAGIRTAAARPFVFAAVWTAVLWAREWMFTGFPWNPLGNIAIRFGPVANSMALFGALGLAFVIAGLIASSVEIARAKKRAMCMIPWLTFVFVLCGGAIYGAYNMWRANANPADAGPLIRIVQPATSQTQKMSYSRDGARARAEENVRRMAEMGARAGTGDAGTGDARPDLIVYPETSYPFVVTDDDMVLAKILGANVVMGATSYADGRLYNSMVVAGADGRVSRVYNKSHLVPFGEYSPMGLMPSPADLSKGAGADVITVGGAGRFSFAPAICYEIIFSDAVVPRGASVDAIINITNDTWFGRTPGTYQHLDMVRRYAIESGLPVVRANYSGISAFVASDGAVARSIPVGQASVMDGRVAGAHMTAYRALGRDAWMLIILGGAVIMVVALRRKRAGC